MPTKKHIEINSTKSVNLAKELTLSVDTYTEKASTAAIGMRIKEARVVLGLSQQDLADAVGGSKRGIQDNESGKNAPASTLIRGLVSLGINANWLLTGIKPMLMADLAHTQDIGVEFALVPQHDIEVSAGHGRTEQRESEIGKLAFRRDWLRQKGLLAKDLVVVRITGDSMSPTIRDGALVLVDTRVEHVKEDGIYVLVVDDRIMAKRMQRDFKGGVFIRSDNPAYREQHLTAEEASGLYVIGRVIWAGGEV